jgi:hypothetical protein
LDTEGHHAAPHDEVVKDWQKVQHDTWTQPSRFDKSALARPDFDPGIKLIEKSDGMYLEITLDEAWARQTERPLVTTDLLGKTKIFDLPYQQPDGTPYRLDTDYFGKTRNVDNPFPGPFELPEGDKYLLKIWPVAPSQ